MTKKEFFKKHGVSACAFARKTGLSREQFRRRLLNDSFTPEERKRFRETLAQLRKDAGEVM